MSAFKRKPFLRNSVKEKKKLHMKNEESKAIYFSFLDNFYYIVR